MRKLLSHSILFIVGLFVLSGYKGDSSYRTIPNTYFQKGEVLTYRAHYGMLTAAYGTMVIENDIYHVNNRPCFKIDIFGETAGLFDVTYQVRDNWGVYMDTSAILPQKAYRYIAEGRYRKNEIINFDHTSNTAAVYHLRKKSRALKKITKHAVPNNVVDLVGGYYYLRTIDFSKYSPGDTIHVDGFFDKKIYNFNLVYRGKEMLNTELGEIKSLVISPVMEPNALFRGREPIRAWISDDLNKVPLKIKAKIFVGSFDIDITSAKNLRH